MIRSRMRRIDPVLDAAIVDVRKHFANKISLREASKILGENHFILKQKKKPYIVVSYP